MSVEEPAEMLLVGVCENADQRHIPLIRANPL